MDTLLNIVQTILGMGAVVILPIMIFILGLVFRMKIGQALQSGLMIGIGFQGLLLVIGLLMSSIKPVVDYYHTMGGGFTTVDIGWAALGAASWTVPFAPLAVPLIIVANVILIKFGWTKVMNVDMWNYIHFLIPGALAYALFDSFALGLGITVGLSIITLFIAEKVAPHWEKEFGLEGTTCSTLSFISYMWPIAIILNKIIDAIPGLNNFELDLNKLQSKIGFFGNPAFIGLIVGVLLGVITHQPFATVTMIGMGLAGVLLLIPRMVSVMMEGLTPIGNAANDFMQKHVSPDANLWIGMDVCLGLGHPTCIVCTAVCIPFTILLAFLIPGMSYFPIGTLTSVCYITVLCVMASKGKLVRSLICCMVSMFLIVWGANQFAVEATAMINSTNLHVEGLITDAYFGFSLPNIIVCLLHRLIA
ncbi:PTS transporter subunit IIC [Pectinatus frisingensis]|uniref:PTS transporter subunit IIC n=1 Tax=Pectinatus frisingensis TaxID=865 RepID=UPI0018C56D65|nr:PTS transporter subunit IIC [Pectinatus frisingensis]